MSLKNKVKTVLYNLIYAVKTHPSKDYEENQHIIIFSFILQAPVFKQISSSEKCQAQAPCRRTKLKLCPTPNKGRKSSGDSQWLYELLTLCTRIEMTMSLKSKVKKVLYNLIYAVKTHH